MAHLITGRLRVPKSPLVHERMLDVEVVCGVENSELFLVIGRASRAIGNSIRLAVRGGDGNLGEGTLFVWNGRLGRFSHGDCL